MLNLFIDYHTTLITKQLGRCVKRKAVSCGSSGPTQKKNNQLEKYCVYQQWKCSRAHVVTSFILLMIITPLPWFFGPNTTS